MSLSKCVCTSSEAIKEPLLKNILPVHYSYSACQFISIDERSFNARFRLNARTQEELRDWLDEFAVSSCTTFKPSKTFPACKYILHRVDMRCHHNTRPTHGTKPTQKHTGCKATMSVVLKQPPSSKNYESKDVHIREYPSVVYLRNEHNHSLQAADILKYRDISSSVTNAFIKMFDNGLTPARALSLYISDLQQKHIYDFHIISADRSICPDMQSVYYIYYQVFKQRYGSTSGEGMWMALHSFVEKYNIECKDICAKIERFSDDNFGVVIVTPLMKRVLQNIKETSEVLFVDSTGNVDKHGCRVFLLLTNSCCGGLPAGIIVCSSESEVVLTACLTIYKSFLDSSSFVGRGLLGPKVIITDDSTAERNALSHAFPNAILYLCIFHVLQAAWRYVWSKKSKVSTEHKQDIFFGIKRLLFCKSCEELEEMYKKLLTSEIMLKHPVALEYIKKVFKRKEEWALAYRKEVCLRGQNTNNISEAAIRVLKDHILDRTKAYSITQLFDFIVLDFDNFYSQKIISVANGRPQAYLKKHFQFPLKALEPLRAEQLQESVFVVRNEVSKTEYTVDVEAGVCTCPYGENGKVCKHQYIIMKNFVIEMPLTLPKNPATRKNLLFVGSGQTNIPPEWYDPLLSASGNVSEHEPSQCQQIKEMQVDISQNEAMQAEVYSEAQTQVAESSEWNEEMEVEACSQIETASVTKGCHEKLLHNIQKTMNKVLEEAESDETVFTAAEVFVKNFEKLNTRSALVSALTTFGKYSGLSTVKQRKKFVSLKKIGVQPTALARRKASCGGRSCLQSGRPPKHSYVNEHGYSKSGKKKKRTAAPHNLSYCTTMNIPLGKKH